MTKEELIFQAKRIMGRSQAEPSGALVEAKAFLRTYVGPDNEFLKTINTILQSASEGYITQQTKEVLNSFIQYIENGLLRTISLEREIQIETVSDYLEQAEILLKDNKIHPAAPTVIIGASLEEFLRTWLIDIGVDLTTINLNLDSFAKELKSRDLINKQDMKDIISWGGTRNDAAHGHWENVADRNRIKLMLEGVNLFMRKYNN